MLTLPDDHAAWRLVGAWIAARQRGEPHAIAALAVPDPARATELAADLDALARLSPGPLRTGATLEVDARARVVTPDHIDGLQITLRGATDSGPVVSSLTLARLERHGDAWRLAALFTPEERRYLDEPAFLQMLAARP